MNTESGRGQHQVSIWSGFHLIKGAIKSCTVQQSSCTSVQGFVFHKQYLTVPTVLYLQLLLFCDCYLLQDHNSGMQERH